MPIGEYPWRAVEAIGNPLQEEVDRLRRENEQLWWALSGIVDGWNMDPFMPLSTSYLRALLQPAIDKAKKVLDEYPQLMSN